MRSLKRCWQVLAVFFVAFVLKEEGISSTTTKHYMKLENKKQEAVSSASSLQLVRQAQHVIQVL